MVRTSVWQQHNILGQMPRVTPQPGLAFRRVSSMILLSAFLWPRKRATFRVLPVLTISGVVLLFKCLLCLWGASWREWKGSNESCLVRVMFHLLVLSFSMCAHSFSCVHMAIWRFRGESFSIHWCILHVQSAQDTFCTFIRPKGTFRGDLFGIGPPPRKFTEELPGMGPRNSNTYTDLVEVQICIGDTHSPA